MSIKPLLFIFAYFCFWSTLWAQEDKAEIVWLQHNRPPWLISEGTYKNQGYGDKTREILTNRYLKDYDHILLPVNPSRENILVTQTNQNICIGPNLKHKPYVSHLYWSKPIYTLPKARIILTKEKLEELNNIEEISMEELIQNEKFRFGNIKSAKYYPLDIKNYLNQKNIYTISSGSPLTHLLKMMRKNRIDWIFDHPVFVRWDEILSQNNEDKFRTIRVTEDKDTPNPVAYIACRKNEFGKKIIDTINKNLTQKDILDIRKEVRIWQLDENTKKFYDKLNQDYFGY